MKQEDYLKKHDFSKEKKIKILHNYIITNLPLHKNIMSPMLNQWCTNNSPMIILNSFRENKPVSLIFYIGTGSLSIINMHIKSFLYASFFRYWNNLKNQVIFVLKNVSTTCIQCLISFNKSLY